MTAVTSSRTPFAALTAALTALAAVVLALTSGATAHASVPAEAHARAAGSVAMMAAAPTPSRIPRGRCAAVKFNWGVASSYGDDAFFGTMTVKLGARTIGVQNAQRIAPNRWNYLMARVCKPGTYTMIVRGDFMKDPNPNLPVRYDRILDKRSYIIR